MRPSLVKNSTFQDDQHIAQQILVKPANDMRFSGGASPLISRHDCGVMGRNAQNLELLAGRGK